MMRRIGTILIGVTVALSHPAWAQATRVVTSGEHASFSRLVFPSPTDLSWTVTSDTDTVLIDFGEPRVAFNTSGVFDRIPRQRLRDIRGGDGELELSLACDCDVRVFQIPSGHIVIDVNDPTVAPTAALDAPDDQPSLTPAAEPTVLPLKLSPVATLSRGLSVTSSSVASAETQQENPATSGATSPPVQIRIQDQTRPSLLPFTASTSEQDRLSIAACAIEARAAEVLNSDPSNALADLPVNRVNVVDSAGNRSPEGLQTLVDTYLSLGWGTEALHILDQLEADQDIPRRIVATALDASPNFGDDQVLGDPACGPATTSLLLISGPGDIDWDAVDAEALVHFIDRLPPIRRRDLEPRLRDGLVRLGKEETLARLTSRPARQQTEGAVSAEITAAGTDEQAIRATLDLLRNSPAPLSDAQRTILGNALALRRSIPDGPLKDEFDDALAQGLLLSGHTDEAIDVIDKSPDRAAEMLAMVLDERPPEDALEIAVRLRPSLPSNAAVIDDVARLMRTFGLTEAAAEYEAIRPGEGLPARPVLARDPATAEGDPLTSIDQAWLERDFTRVAEEEVTESQTPRSLLAQYVVERNDTTLPSDDFTRAEYLLDSSRSVSSVISALLNEGQSIREQ